MVTIGSFRGRASQVDGDARGRLAEILYRAAEAAAPRGVRLALEPLNRYESDLIDNHDEGLAFIQQVNHPSLGLLLDTYHVNIEEILLDGTLCGGRWQPGGYSTSTSATTTAWPPGMG